MLVYEEKFLGPIVSRDVITQFSHLVKLALKLGAVPGGLLGSIYLRSRNSELEMMSHPSLCRSEIQFYPG